MFGPALTRLTANMAANMLQGKQLVCWMPRSAGMHDQDNADAAECKGQLLGSMVIDSSNSSMRSSWPPADRASLQHAAPVQVCKPFWFEAHADCSWPSGEQHVGDGLQAGQAQRTCLVPSWRGLHVTSDAGYRQATAEELRQFVGTSAAADAEVYDVFLCSHPYIAPVYVFLDPHPLCVTGRCKAAPGQITILPGLM